ncbi:MAG: hypothetical protein ACTSPT_04910 [Candidatus Heimdallarchaeota archaeon]
MKRTKDDIGSTIDGEDNLAKMIMIEQAIDSAEEITEEVSRSYAFCDCVITIVELARETNNKDALEGVKPLLKKIENISAYVRAQSYYAIALASFNEGEEAQAILQRTIKKSYQIKDDFDRRDAILDIATAAGDVSFLSENKTLIETALNLSPHLAKGQIAYLYGYLANILDGEESKSLMREAVEIAGKVKDPIIRSKVFLELAGLMSNFKQKYE